jgi:hypothetical protein
LKGKKMRNENKANNLAPEGGDTYHYTIHHWGPLLFKTKIRPKDLTAIKKLCSKSNEDWSKNLAGIIKDELIVNSNEFTKIITPYLRVYGTAYKEWYGIKLNAIETTYAWVNFMKNGESNPPHIHHDCHLSSVLVLDIPKSLQKEQKAWKGTGGGPATLHFLVGNPQNFHVNQFEFRPEVGDFFIFPWNLTHSVSTYRSKCVRATVAANFKINDGNVFEKKEVPDGQKEA